MRTTVTLVISLLLLVALAPAALAQAEQYDVGVFADEAGTMSTTTVPPFSPITLYVVAFGLDRQVKAYEVSLTMPADILIQTVVFAGPGPINLGDVPGEYIIGTGACIDGLPQLTLATLSGFFTTANLDVPVCIGGTDPSSFGGLPGYVQCDNTLVPFGVAQNGQGNYPNGCFVFNSTGGSVPVAVEVSSFGEVKARF